jgi:tetratricopeptide (TPR) repeat protein
MDRKPPRTKPLEVEPVEVVRPDVGLARAQTDSATGDGKGHRDLRMTTSDEFLSKAAAEYEKGHVDQALWRKAQDQCGEDVSLVVAAYLRGRAKALRQQHEQAQPAASIHARGASSTRSATEPEVEPERHEKIVSTKFRGDRPRSSKLKAWHLIVAVVAIAATVAVVYVMVSPPENAPARQPAPSNAAPSPSGQPVAKSTAGGTNPAVSDVPLSVTVQQLKNAGNWHLMVLNATEWTRREPGNATAWNELGIGYAKLGQFGDALDAAKKAVQLSPGDALFWRNLGRLNLELDRLPEAESAFAKALAISPDDADARCGAALVAQRQARPKDANTQVMRVKVGDASCPDMSAGTASPTPAPGSTERKSLSPAGR